MANSEEIDCSSCSKLTEATLKHELKFSRKKSSQYYTDDRPELRFIPRRTRSTVSHLCDEHDQWGINELDAKEEHTLILHDHQHKNVLLDRLNALRRNRELCDVVLFVQEHEILAHKVVLASISDALFDMFVTETDAVAVPNTPISASGTSLLNGGGQNGSMSNSSSRDASAPSENGSNSNSNSNSGPNGLNDPPIFLADETVPIEIVASRPSIWQTVGGMTTADKRYSNYFEFAQGDFDCFEAIVNFAYTSRLEISSWKVADLYKTAYCLQVVPIVNTCARYLAENLSVNNCIGIRRQANFNMDVYLAGKVDTFIADNIEKIITESDEFTQLPCIKLRIITDGSSHAEDGLLLTEKALNYCQNYPRLSDRIDQQIEALVEKAHLLLMGEDQQTLQNLCDTDDQSSVGSCDIVQDYKRCGQTAKTAGHNSNPIGAHLVQHRVTGAKAVKINASRVANAKYASNESLNSAASTASTADDEIETRLIAFYNNSPGFYIAIVVLYRRMVVLSIRVSEDDDVIRSINKNPAEINTAGVMRSYSNSATGAEDTQQPLSVAASTMPNSITSSTLREIVANALETPKATRSPSDLLNSYDAYMVGDVPPSNGGVSIGSGGDLGTLLHNYRHDPLPSMNQARCSNGAVFVNGQIIVFGGYNRGECLSSAEAFDVATEEWLPLPEMGQARGRFDSALDANGYIYAIAGSNGNNDLRTCERYNPKTKTWTEICPLSKARSHNGCTAVDNYIYCVGGSSDQSVLKDCERYDPKTNKWMPIAPLQTPRFQGGCTFWRGFVVYCAGCDRWNCLGTVEIYDPRTNTWRYLPKLKTPRRGCAVAVMRDSLYVIGGHNGTQSLASVEVLDHVNSNAWRTGPLLTVARANTHAVVTASSTIYVLGGFNGNQFLDSIEVLENESLGWRSWRKPQGYGQIVEEDSQE